MQQNPQKLKEIMSTSPTTNLMEVMVENMQYFREINQLRYEQKIIVWKMDPLQEGSFRVIEHISIVQGAVKQAIQDSMKNLKEPIIIQIVERIIEHETQENEKVTTTKETMLKLVGIVKEQQLT